MADNTCCSFRQTFTQWSKPANKNCPFMLFWIEECVYVAFLLRWFWSHTSNLHPQSHRSTLAKLYDWGRRRRWARWCVLHLFCRCVTVIYTPQRQQQAPRRWELFVSGLRRGGGEERETSGRQKQMSLLDYHLSPSGGTLSCPVWSAADVGACPPLPLPGTENSGLISQYRRY